MEFTTYKGDMMKAALTSVRPTSVYMTHIGV